MKFIALLRGINVGGKNKVTMSELKSCFENLGFGDVITYINSGNVIFRSDQTDKIELTDICEQAIKKQFGFRVICSVISAAELQTSLANAPKWWGNDSNKDSKHNALFVIPPMNARELIGEVGEAKHEYELVETVGQIIFWTAPLKTFSRTRYSKIVGTKSYKSITIRSANTTKKLAELCR